MLDPKSRDAGDTLRLLFEATGDAVMLLDRGGAILDISDSALMLLGQRTGSRDLIDESFFKMLWQQDAQGVREAFRETAEAGVRTRAHGRLQEDPASQWFEWQFTRLDASQGAKSPVLAVARDASESRRIEQSLRHEAVHDKLTGLPNRALFSDRLGVTIAQAKRTNAQFSVLMMDLDGFKKINEALGHQTGDALLKIAANRLAGALRETDTIARFGGDEFMVLLPGAVSEVDIHTVARRLLVALQPPFDLGGRRLYVTSSIGAALFPRDGTTEEALLGAADAAMYQAKATQGGRCVVFDGQVHADAVESVSLEEALYQAVREGQFLLHYQPLVSAQSGQIEGFEALMRWNCPGVGMISPVQFIPMAESNGLITLLGTWALKVACMQAKHFSQMAGRPLSMSVNVSPRQFRSDNFVDGVRCALELSGLAPEQLMLEVTEGILMSDPEHATKLLSQFAKSGVRIAIDDFGTGYSSLAYLKSLPVNSLKIDRSFVKDLPGSTKDAAICRAVLGMARELGLYCTAEGIEEAEQAKFLTENGCKYLQGYMLGRPMPAETVTPAILNAIQNTRDVPQKS